MTTAISQDLRARLSEIVNQHIDAENRHDPDGVVASLHQPATTSLLRRRRTGQRRLGGE
jgi:hypothetical protein